MSSYDTNIYVPDSERDAVFNEIRDTENYIARKKEQIEKLKKQTEETEKEVKRIKEENGRRMEEAVNNLVSSHRNKLSSFSGIARSEVEKQTDSLIRSLGKLRDDALSNSMRADRLNEEALSVSQLIGSTINNYMSRETDNSKRAQLVLEELHGMISQIEKLNPILFKPTEYHRLLNLTNQVAENITRGDFNAALSVSQGGMLESAQLLTRLIILNEQYSERYASVMQQAATLGWRIGELESEADGAIPVSIDDETIEYEYDISFWSGGNFDSIKDNYENIQNILNTGDKKIPFDQLDAISAEIENLDNILTECDRLAREELISSANVFNTAEMADEYLSQIGYRLEESGFTDDDDRKPYTMTYVNGNGSKLAAVVSSSGNSERPRFIMEVIGDNPVEADITKRGVLSGLQSMGAELGNTTVSEDCSDNVTSDHFINRVVGECEQQRLSRKPTLTRQI